MSERPPGANQAQPRPHGLQRWLLPVALAIMVVEITIIALFLRNGQGQAPSEQVASGQGVPAATATARVPAPVAMATETAPRPTASLATAAKEPTHVPTLVRIPTPMQPPPVATPAPQASAPTTAPTAEPQPTQSVAVAPTRQSAPPPPGNLEPAETVRRFYDLVERGSFEQASQYWSARMKANYPPSEHIAGRFSRVQSIDIRRADLTSLDSASGTASVVVDLVEVGGSPPTTRHWVGTWYLVRGPGGWLLDQPSLRPA